MTQLTSGRRPTFDGPHHVADNDLEKCPPEVSRSTLDFGKTVEELLNAIRA